MEPCHEYLGCNKTDCIMFHENGGKRCWEIEGTLCNHPGIDLMRKNHPGDKVDACKRAGCIYYQAASKRGLT